MARPAKGEKFPAMFIPQWAGVYPLEKAWVTDRAKEGWLVLNILARQRDPGPPATILTPAALTLLVAHVKRGRGKTAKTA